jgi:hypothetical protein
MYVLQQDEDRQDSRLFCAAGGEKMVFAGVGIEVQCA